MNHCRVGECNPQLFRVSALAECHPDLQLCLQIHGSVRNTERRCSLLPSAPTRQYVQISCYQGLCPGVVSHTCRPQRSSSAPVVLDDCLVMLELHPGHHLCSEVTSAGGLHLIENWKLNINWNPSSSSTILQRLQVPPEWRWCGSSKFIFSTSSSLSLFICINVPGAEKKDVF